MRTVSGAGARSLVVLLSGPNLDLLGERQPEVYGTATLVDHVAAAVEEADRCGLELEHHQTNHEGELVELVHGARGRAAALIVNAGALTHYSWSLHDALAAFDGIVVELHLSNPAGARAVAPHLGGGGAWRTGRSPASVASGTRWRSRPWPGCSPSRIDRGRGVTDRLRRSTALDGALAPLQVADRLARLRPGIEPGPGWTRCS